MKTLCFLAMFAAAFAQDRVLAPKTIELTKYVPPQKPHTKLAELKAKHAGQENWAEPVVDDEHLNAVYISSAPGTKVSRRFHPDTRAWWIVLDGQIRYDIEGQQPFVASKGGMVQVPMQTMFAMETVGDKPSLRLEVNIAKAKTLYPSGTNPPAIPGFEWMTVKMTRTPGIYGRENKPYVTFDQFAKNREQKHGPMTQRFVDDDRGAANFIYGYEKDLPALGPKERGHFHPEGAEFWLIMAGQIRYAIEGQGVIIANEGDLVYAPKFTFHLPRFYGPGPSCRLAMNGYPNIAHLFDPD